jgi:hypothetical protein
MRDESTASFSAAREERAETVVPALLAGIQAQRPWESPALLALGGADEVQIGRGDMTAWQRRDRTAQVTVQDPWMSSSHGSLVKDQTGWLLHDRGSKNGCFVNGVRVKAELLEDGDVLELGSTFFVFRERVPVQFVEGRSGACAAGDTDTFVADLARAYDEIARVAASVLPVLVSGETGTGKEVTARWLHALSRRSGAFCALNCAELPPSLAESELFGHKRGAFSGATEARSGVIRSAHEGTLFLDEIAELDASVQAKLLRVLQEREVRPLGATAPVAVDFRLVAATHVNLKKRVEEGAFRSDLFARIAGYCVELPALRTRPEDIAILVARLLRDLLGESGAREVSLTREAARALYAYSWPRNIRELQRALELALALRTGSELHLSQFPAEVREARFEKPTSSMPDDMLRNRLETLLRVHRGNVSAVARVMGKARVQVRRWCARYEIDTTVYRGSSGTLGAFSLSPNGRTDGMQDANDDPQHPTKRR